VAKRPASYKSSLSLQLPVGTTRKQERHIRNESPKRQHVYVENPAAVIPSEETKPSSSYARDE